MYVKSSSPPWEHNVFYVIQYNRAVIVSILTLLDTDEWITEYPVLSQNDERL